MSQSELSGMPESYDASPKVNPYDIALIWSKGNYKKALGWLRRQRPSPLDSHDGHVAFQKAIDAIESDIKELGL